MSKYLKKFSTHQEYDVYIASEDKVLPNVSICTTEGDVHYNPLVRVSGVTLDRNTLSLSEGDTDTLVATVLPADASNKKVTWSSSDESVATVSSGGVVNGVAVGDANITVTTEDGGFTDSCSLSVKSYKVITYAATSKLNETTATYDTGLHTNVFSGTNGQQLTMVSHTFEDGVGTVTFNDTIVNIGQNAFYRCSGLTSIKIPDSVTSIGVSAFGSCSNLTSCTIGSGVTSIGKNAFYQCYSLTSIEIPDSVTSIGVSAFGSCSGLTSCTIGSGVTTIDTHAFISCSSLTSIDIPDSVTSIGASAFYTCSNLTSCTIGSGVTSIGSDAFYGCSGLTSIVSNATTAPTIQNSTFREVKTGGTLTVPQGSSGYDVWMGTGNYYLGRYGWTKVEQ